MIKVKPDIINPDGFAEVSHDGTSTITVTITNDNGDSQKIDVPPGKKVKWYPPTGWTEARFTSPGCDQVTRLIAKQASA